MNMNEIKAMAKGLGIKSNKMKKNDLIRSIQEKEGNFPCYQTASSYCDQEQCAWRNDCMSMR